MILLKRILVKNLNPDKTLLFTRSVDIFKKIMLLEHQSSNTCSVVTLTLQFGHQIDTTQWLMALNFESVVNDYLFSASLVTDNWFKIQLHLPTCVVNVTSECSLHKNRIIAFCKQRKPNTKELLPTRKFWGRYLS